MVAAFTGQGAHAVAFGAKHEARLGFGKRRFKIGTGFAIAFAESAAKQVWLAIERGRLVGKQFILYRNPTMIGASYGNDVFLFKDPSVQQQHARIVKRGGGYTVEASPGALLRVNGQPVVSRTIQSGDTLQVGETLMRFHARA